LLTAGAGAGAGAGALAFLGAAGLAASLLLYLH